MPAKLKMSKPEYIYIDSKVMKIHKDSEKKIKIIAGKFGDAEGPIKGHNIEPVYFDIELEKNKEFNFDLPSTHNSFIFSTSGPPYLSILIIFIILQMYHYDSLVQLLIFLL